MRSLRVRPVESRDVDAIVRLSLRAWSPVFPSVEAAIGPEIYRVLTPDPHGSQRREVEAVCADKATQVWVTEIGEALAGFVAVRLRSSEGFGEIYMLAVDPEFQRRGIGASLMTFALEEIKAAGMAVAMVETGADPGHAPARATYEKAGCKLVPIARYFKKL